jgi:hypothetical protein
MAAYSYYPEHGKSLTAMRDKKEGDVVMLSVGSNAYSLPQNRFGWQGSEFTKYVLPAPVGVNQFGDALFDLAEIGQCPLDDSFQNEATLNAARKREWQRPTTKDQQA